MQKTTILALFFLMALSNSAISQVHFGAKLGIHSFDLNDPSDIILQDDQSIQFTEAKMGFQGGVYTRIEIGRGFIEPRIMLHSTSVEYTFDGENGGLFNNVVEEKFTNLDIPLLIGTKLLFFDVYGGPVAHINMQTTSDLFDWDEYDEMFSTANYGYRLGLGFDIGKINIGVEYEGNFSAFGDHISIGGQQFSFDDRPSRVIANLGIRIF